VKALKRVVSISLGSSKRDHKVEAEFLGEKFSIERRGTDGELEKMKALLRELDGQVDAFGLGGMDLYVWVGDRRYVFREAAQVARIPQKTPVVDGSGLKNTLEREVINYLQEQGIVDFKNKKVLMVCALDRYSMAEAMEKHGAQVTCGDLIFALGLPVPLRSVGSFRKVAHVIAPLVCQLPFRLLYPTGKEQEKNDARYQRYYHEADIIAGDFHFIRRHLPPHLPGRIIITNTVTREDVEELKRRGIKLLITTTPEFNGRSFGTNVMEGVLLVLSGKSPDTVTREDYLKLLKELQFQPRVVELN